MTQILMVEDDSSNRLVVEDMFAFDDIPADLVYVETGEETVEMAEQRQPILILLDVRLPGMDGLETARALKENPRTRDIPIWGVTAQAMEGDRQEAMQAGFQRYITKTFDTRHRPLVMM